jgi:hypothetical protein
VGDSLIDCCQILTNGIYQIQASSWGRKNVFLRNVVVTACRVQHKRQQFRGLDPPSAVGPPGIVQPMIRVCSSATGL